MRTSATILQIAGFLTSVGSLVIGGLSLTNGGFSGVAIIVVGVMVGAFLWALSEAFYALDRIAAHTERSANADERTAFAIELMAHRVRNPTPREPVPAPERQASATVLRNLGKHP